MIRRLIILLLIVGCVFGDTIKWQDAKGKRYDITNVEFQNIKYQRVFYLDNRGIKGIIECPKIVSITDSEGNEIEFDCGDDSKETYEEGIKVGSSKDVQSTIQNTQKPLVGGIFIAFGGAILISQNEKDFEDIDDIEEFKFITTIAYALITLGGVLIGLGI